MEYCKIKPVFVKKLKVCMEKQQKTLRQVSTETRITYSMLWKWCQIEDPSMPSIQNLEKIADYFKVSDAYFLSENADILKDDLLIKVQQKKEECPIVNSLLEKLVEIDEKYLHFLNMVVGEVDTGKIKVIIEP